ncbi:HD family phosphohydrolase [Clostridium novyi A str. 4570]|uniref:HD family phosphohydrolase n=1 Tax=Clostridium novyi A str. 4570 TaxID=1444290 RepID=A0AA89CNS3_CLONO|nr:HD-GYP domain-containing protein [Clostridium novyi]KGN02510.1 HD family phosphohydrolase [Clostridium novyi A str. 4570]
MRLEFIENLKGCEILAKDILSSTGEILLKTGVKIENFMIPKLKRYGVFMVYIKDNRFSDVIEEDNVLTELKQTTLEIMPNLFNELLEGDTRVLSKSMYKMDNLIEQIINQNSINISLYEVKTYDNYTYIHCVDTGIMSVYLGACLNLDTSKIKELGISAMLHDIGKIKVPNEIINKHGTLTDEEFDEIKKHPIYGRDILTRTNLFSEDIIRGVAEHHERIDGKGYPYGLKGEEISTYGKIITVSDVFTAVSANRSYREKFDPNEAYEFILAGMGTKFDKEVINKFKENFAIYPLGCGVKLSNGVQGYVIKQNKNFPDRPIIRVVYDIYTNEPVQPYDIDLMKNMSLTIKSVC